MHLDRRQFLQSAAALGASIALPAAAAVPARKESRIELIPSEFKATLDPASPKQTSVWSFNEKFPGPVLRFRRGDRAHITEDIGELVGNTKGHSRFARIWFIAPWGADVGRI